MRIEFEHKTDIGAVIVTGTENCDTDARPLVGSIEFRHHDVAFDQATGCIAGAIIFADYCGELVEFAGAAIGFDHRDAIKLVLPEARDVYPIDAGKREISQGGDAIVVGEADRLYRHGFGSTMIDKPARVVSWSGDFVGSGERDSRQYVGGEMFTNAKLLAGSSAVSVAIGLLVGGRNLQEIFVPDPASGERQNLVRISAALDHVGIRVKYLPPANSRRRGRTG